MKKKESNLGNHSPSLSNSPTLSLSSQSPPQNPTKTALWLCISEPTPPPWVGVWGWGTPLFAWGWLGVCWGVGFEAFHH